MHGKLRQVSIYADPQILRLLEREAQERHRKLGPTVAAIVREYFEKKENTNVRNETQDS